MTLKQFLCCAAIVPAIGLAVGQQAEPAGGSSVVPAVDKGATADKGAQNDLKQDETSGLQITRFMPLGKPNLRVKIPQFKDGILECVMRAEEMTRVSEDDVNIKLMEIEFVGEGDSEMKIELKDATYNLSDKLISSKNRAIVRRSDFTLIGDSLDFDTEKRHGRMTGKVRMVIHDSRSLMKGKGAEKESRIQRQPKGMSVAEAAGLVLQVIEHNKEESREISHDQEP
ncbi:MAG: hypothetical protein VCA55_08315 [Verrucomicrobiales bacterium]